VNPIDFSAADHLGRRLHTADTHGKAGDKTLKVDAVIIGSGPGGMVTGKVLAEAGLKVVIVEDGRFWAKGTFKRKQSWAAKHLMQDQGTRVMTGNAFIPVASGRGVGGGTLVNSAICFRAPDSILDEWIDEWGLDFWRKEDREALFSEVEQAIGVSPTPATVAGDNSFVAQRGFNRLGLKSDFMPRNAPGCVGCGTCQTGCPTGGKATADLIFLPAMLRQGGEIYADTRAEKILVEAGRAVGIEAVMRAPETGEAIAKLTIRADKVIVAAGAVNSALILQQQGLANSSDQVGRNLHVHPTCGVVARMEEDVRIWSGATQGYYAYHPDDPEILLESFSASPDVFLSQVAQIGVHDTGEFLRQFRKLAAVGLLIRDHSSGVVRPTRSGKPKITYNLGRADVRKMLMGLETIVDMFFAAGSRRVMPMLYRTRFFSSRNEARTFIRESENPADMSLYASHPMGTCRIGADPRKSVVRPEDGRTHDVEGLYVTDSSLFPSALGANPQVTIMAQSLALARRMVG
jgi:choline dehydrogenase-like flavoprotein